jgi:hypothetical protein
MRSKPHLFPHAYLPEPAVRKLVFFFGPARIYQPWFLNPPGFFKNVELEVLYPPEDLKPSGDFKAILSNYHSWAEQSLDRSIKETAKFSGKVIQNDNPTWEIRRLLKGTAMPARDLKGEDLKLKWHLLLHLASDMERQQFELMDMMEKLKGKKPVLAGALNEPDEAKDMFADVDDIRTPVLPDNPNLLSLLDAWFGLFSGYLKEKDLLITYSRPVMDFILSRWDERIEGGKTADSPSFSFRLPDISSEGHIEGDIMKIRELVLKFGEDPDHCMNELLPLTKKVEETFPRESSKGILEFQLRKFSSTHGERSFEANDPLRYIADKTIILMSSL